MKSPLMRLLSSGAEPIETGRQRLVEAAVEEKFGQTNGKFYRNGEIHEEPSEIHNEEYQRRIWDVCTKYSGL